MIEMLILITIEDVTPILHIGAWRPTLLCATCKKNWKIGTNAWNGRWKSENGRRTREALENAERGIRALEGGGGCGLAQGPHSAPAR